MGPLGRGELIIRGGGGVSVLTENQESILRQCLSAADLASPTTRDLSRCWGDFVVAGWETPWGLYVPNKVTKLTCFGYVVRKNAGPWRQGTRVRCLARKKEKTKENGRLAIDLVGGSGVVALWSRRGVRSVFFFFSFPLGRTRRARVLQDQLPPVRRASQLVSPQHRNVSRLLSVRLLICAQICQQILHGQIPPTMTSHQPGARQPLVEPLFGPGQITPPTS